MDLSSQKSCPSHRFEATLSEWQNILFRQRLEEGYDVTIDDLTTLDAHAKDDYWKWVIWKSLGKDGDSLEADFVLHGYYPVLFTRGTRKVCFFILAE